MSSSHFPDLCIMWFTRTCMYRSTCVSLDMQQVSGRSDISGVAKSVASSARSVVHPAMGRLFDTADRRQAGWLNVTDIQVRASLQKHFHAARVPPATARSYHTFI